MNTLQKQIVNSFNGLPEESLKKVLDYIKQLSSSITSNKKVDQSLMTESGIQRIGIAQDKFIYADDYDFDEYNDEIAKMFGVNA